MSLMVGNRSFDKTTSKNIHYTVMFWLDEGLLEKGFYVNITSDYYMGNKNFHNLQQVENNVYEFPLQKLVWQSSLNTDFGQISRFSGLYVEGNYYANTTSNYITDYHSGHVTFSDSVWNNITNLYGSSPSVAANYCAKEIYVNYDNNDVLKAQMSYIINNYDKDINFEELPIKLPMIAGTLNSQKLFPYEIGGTRYIRTGYSILVVTDTQEMRDQIGDLILKQKDVRLPSRNWKPLYNESNVLQYDTTDQYINDCSLWREIYIEDIDEKRYGNGPYFADYDVVINIVGAY